LYPNVVVLLRGSVTVSTRPCAVYVIVVVRFWLAVTFSVTVNGPAAPWVYVVSPPSGLLTVRTRPWLS
jgi:hypothetical protein